MSADASNDVIDRNKIRSRNDIRKEVNDSAKIKAAEIQSLYYDGRKDQTSINGKKGESYDKKKYIIEEYITLIQGCPTFLA